MKNLENYINEAKEYFYNKNNIIIYGGDHQIDRMFDRKIRREIIEKTINKVIYKIIDLLYDNSISIGDEFIIRNKNTKPYLNLPMLYDSYKNSKHTFILKTGIYKNDFKTNNIFIDIYA